jgi:hypothetical protein
MGPWGRILRWRSVKLLVDGANISGEHGLTGGRRGGAPESGWDREPRTSPSSSNIH